jgi:hypothetical protein
MQGCKKVGAYCMQTFCGDKSATSGQPSDVDLTHVRNDDLHIASQTQTGRDAHSTV